VQTGGDIADQLARYRWKPEYPEFVEK